MGQQAPEQVHRQQLPPPPHQHGASNAFARMAHEERRAMAESPAASDKMQDVGHQDGELQENVAMNGSHCRPDGASGRGSKTSVVGGLHQQGAQSTRGGPCARLLRGLADRRRTPPRGDVTPRRGREHPVATPSPLSSAGMRGVRGVLEGIVPWHRACHETSALMEGSPLARSHAKGTPVCRRSPLSEGSPVLAAPQLHADRSSDDMQSSPDHMHFDHMSPVQQSPNFALDGHERWQSHATDSRLDAMDNSGWTCAACTLINAPDATRCAVCDALRGSTLASAATLAEQRMGQLAMEAPVAKDKQKADAPKGRTGQQPLRGQTRITSFLRL